MLESNPNYVKFEVEYYAIKSNNYRESCQRYVDHLKESAASFEKHLSDPEWMKNKTVGEVKIYV